MRSGVRRWVAVVGTAVALAAGTTSARADVPADLRLGSVTGTGVHNTYDRATFPRLTAGLDALTATGDRGPRLVEIDVWTLYRRWIVAHDLPFLGAADNNCARGDTLNQDLAGCLANLRSWHDAHPGHPPIVLKVEFKNGFAAGGGFGPAQFDALLTGRLGGALYRPADLLGGRPDLAAAAAADNWATLGDLAGRFVVLAQTGTFEEANPLDTLHTDVEYARYLRSAPAAAAAFPVVTRGDATGDPRAAFPAELRPWFVAVDTTAAGFAALPAEIRRWYVTGRLWVVGTDADAVPPALDPRTPTTAQATTRVRELACAGVSIASADWATVPGWHVSYPRGTCALSRGRSVRP